MFNFFEMKSSNNLDLSGFQYKGESPEMRWQPRLRWRAGEVDLIVKWSCRLFPEEIRFSFNISGVMLKTDYVLYK